MSELEVLRQAIDIAKDDNEDGDDKHITHWFFSRFDTDAITTFLQAETNDWQIQKVLSKGKELADTYRKVYSGTHGANDQYRELLISYLKRHKRQMSNETGDWMGRMDLDRGVADSAPYSAIWLKRKPSQTEKEELKGINLKYQCLNEQKTKLGWAIEDWVPDVAEMGALTKEEHVKKISAILDAYQGWSNLFGKAAKSRLHPDIASWLDVGHDTTVNTATGSEDLLEGLRAKLPEISSALHEAMKETQEERAWALEKDEDQAHFFGDENSDIDISRW